MPHSILTYPYRKIIRDENAPSLEPLTCTGTSTVIHNKTKKTDMKASHVVNSLEEALS